MQEKLLVHVVQRAEEHFETQQWSAARDVLQLGAKIAPERADLHSAIGSMSYLMRDFSGARAAFEAAVALRPDSLEFLIQLAVCELKMGLISDSARNLQHALAYAPNDANVLAYTAAVYTAQGRHSEAMQLYRRAADLGVEDKPEVLVALAQSQWALGDIESARRTLGKVEVLEPSNEAAAALRRELSLPESPKIVSAAPLDAWGREIKVESGLTLQVGRSSYVHGNLIRNPSGARTAVSIGHFTSIATGVSIVGYDHHSEWIAMFPFLDDGTRDLWPGTRGIPYPQSPEYGSNKSRGDVVIGSDVWIGVDVKIFKGVTIGDGAVIGAGAVVNKSIPPFTVAAGVPARPIRKRFSDEEIALLARVKWWDWPDAAINKHMRVLCSGDVRALERIDREGMLSLRGGKLAMDSSVPEPDGPAARYLADFPESPGWIEGQISREDATFLYDILSVGIENTVLEIGVASGWSSAILLYLLKQNPPRSGDNKWLRSYDIGELCYFDSNRRVGSVVPEVVPELRCHWELRLGDARTARTDLAGQSVDFAFVDANHMHPWPTLDLLAILPVLAPGAWVVLHDISLPDFTTTPEWRVHGPKYLYEQWPWEKRSVGGKRNNIGAIRIPPDREQIRKLCEDVLALPWETTVPEEIVAELMGKEFRSPSQVAARSSNEPIMQTGMTKGSTVDATPAASSAFGSCSLAGFVQPPPWVTGHISFEDATLLQQLVDIGVRHSVLEVGVASGWSSAILLHLLSQRPPGSGTDLWLHSYDVGEWCYFDKSRPVGAVVGEVVPHLQRHWKLHVGNAREAGVQLKGQDIELAFIDANHMHPWATFDLLAILPALAPNAWVALHDISLPLFAAKPEWRVYGPKYLYDRWPWEKRSVGGQLNNIGAIRVPGDHVKVRHFCKNVLAVKWETTFPRELAIELLQQSL